ncbi:MAG: hypothetical protein EON92_02685 [Burkholderiales bacterium]|nr:MAG: hypothetical protein EON92_02685 [Burkholderiales bacterium]
MSATLVCYFKLQNYRAGMALGHLTFSSLTPYYLIATAELVLFKVHRNDPRNFTKAGWKTLLVMTLTRCAGHFSPASCLDVRTQHLSRWKPVKRMDKGVPALQSHHSEIGTAFKKTPVCGMDQSVLRVRLKVKRGNKNLEKDRVSKFHGFIV